MLRVADRWIWDSWIADDGDDYHLFFLHAPSSLGDPSLRHARARIGHAVSPDLVEWRLVDDALGPAPTGWDDLALWTGSVARADDGRWFLYYTAINTAGTSYATSASASPRPSDLLTWTRVGDGPSSSPIRAGTRRSTARRAERDVARPVGVPRPRRRRAGTC